MSAFALQKCFAALLMPAGLLWLGIGGAALLAHRRRQRALAWLLGGLFLAFALAGNARLGRALLRSLERAVPPVDPTRVGPFQAVFVMGGGTGLDPLGQPEVAGAGDRVVLAARLWHRGRVGCLVASGATPGGRDLAQETRQIWLDLGVPDAAIRLVDSPCRNSREEIRAYRRLQVQEGWTRVGLLSSASHLPRALALARREGLEATPLGADHQGGSHLFQIQDLVPHGEGFHLVHQACWERLGRWTGR